MDCKSLQNLRESNSLRILQSARGTGTSNLVKHMDHVFYSEPAVKQFLVRNGALFAVIMDDEPEILRLNDERKYALIYSEYIQDKPLQALYQEFYKSWSLDQERLHGSYKYEASVVLDLDALISKYGWHQFILALIELVNRRKAKAYDEQTRGIWVRIRDKLASLNKSVKYK